MNIHLISIVTLWSWVWDNVIHTLRTLSLSMATHVSLPFTLRGNGFLIFVFLMKTMWHTLEFYSHKSTNVAPIACYFTTQEYDQRKVTNSTREIFLVG